MAVRLQGPPPAGYRLQSPKVTPERVQVKGAASAVGRVAQVVAVADTREANLTMPQACKARAVDGSGRVVSAVTVSPQFVEVILPAEPSIASRKVPVVPRLQGLLAPGRRVARLAVEPAEVMVSGSPADLRRLNWVETEEVSVEGAAADFSRSVSLDLPRGVSAVPPGPITVKVLLEGGARASPTGGAPGG